ncbi:electron transport complex subunit RsxA [Natranaerobius thermophilus]|uniref:Ion-translocating oxidoreductase complex subunit A n=1 Tax=Natranaerobius thermophilus (strain ATCC BAA-1301 / DSM 18059 / JW/NM-WN-LF) TaxID=457570 RepID=B2A146_NATTJ|nr:electron transport complex subunit RsxA [Natranaerobius thermophilus]ACB84669.1 electron transport complex, RnfABCDGE type, A subunit [Natranaerobius thermophilus JW/NM-WN-LF]
MIEDLLVIFLGAVLVNNFVLIRFLGICPFLGVSKKVETALGMGFAVTFVMTLSSIITWFIAEFILIPLEAEYLEYVAYILVIASLVQFIEMLLEKVSPSLYKALGIFLPLITTNCAILGLVLINILEDYNLLEATVHGIGAGVGFILALILMAGIRERLELVKMHEVFKGASIAFITAGILALAFSGFLGII